MDWVLSAAVIIGNLLVGKKMYAGWVLLGLNCIGWIVYALQLDPPQYGLIPSAAINFVICGVTLVRWVKEKHAS